VIRLIYFRKIIYCGYNFFVQCLDELTSIETITMTALIHSSFHRFNHQHSPRCKINGGEDATDKLGTLVLHPLVINVRLLGHS
jgi:hypothetical protein